MLFLVDKGLVKISLFMNWRNSTYLLLLIIAFAFVGCHQAKYVPDGYYLLRENNAVFIGHAEEGHEMEDDHSHIDQSDFESLMKPETNGSYKLWVYNQIDSNRYKRQVLKKRKKFNRKTEKRKAKEDKINAKRISKAKKKGETHYKKKIKKEKSPRLGWRNWLIEHWGEAPVLLDTSKISKSKQQMKVYLSQRGFKSVEIHDSIEYDQEKKQAWVTYYVEPGEPYIINNISFDDAPVNKELIYEYNRMVRKEGTKLIKGDLLDEDHLEDERVHFTKFLKDNAFYGFTKKYINFVVDSTIGDYKADIVIYIKEKEVTDPYNPDTTTTLKHFTYFVDEVTYKLHNPDTSSFEDWSGYKKKCEELGFSSPYKDENGQYYLLDTLLIIDTLLKQFNFHFDKEERKRDNLSFFDRHIDTVISYKGYFIFNEKPFIKPFILDKSNFLEHTDFESDKLNYAKDYYIDRTFKSLLRLDVFSRINPRLEIDPNRPLDRFLDVTYDLTPSPKQRFVLEPRATNTSSILGVSGRISYTNKNLFRAGHSLTISVEGGAQSQPLVGGNAADSSKLRFRGLNTFEIGPEFKYKIPRFFPMTKSMREKVSKRAYPSTEITALYNLQKRPEFKRHIAELNYKWKFSIPPDETQRLTITPLIFSYVFLNKEPSFDSLLVATNDPFLINSYSNFFSLGFLNFRHEYTNAALPKSKRNQKFLENAFSNIFDISASGLIVNSIYALADKNNSFGASFNDTNKVLFNIPFAQYVKITNTFIYNIYINRKHRIASRIIIGTGFAYGNGFALPYTQSYVAGGSNDIRAFPARSMAPGSKQVWADPNATETQIGDMKLEMNFEWRFKLGGQWNGAVFVDMGNIWEIKADAPIDPGLFAFDTFIEQIAIGTGFGVRYDLSFLIIRLDVSWPLYNPYLTAGSRWWTRGDKTDYEDAVKAQQATYDFRDWPHAPRLNFGIGYPF
jgi:outer membrane translocation and assembly module TamA